MSGGLPRWATLGLLSGCYSVGSSMEGHWQGECAAAWESTDGDVVSIAFNVSEDDDGDISGDGGFTDFYGERFDGALFGMRDGGDVDLGLVGLADGRELALDMWGAQEDGAIDGDCELYGYSGTLQLTQDPSR